MIKSLQISLIGDGSSDRCLLRIIGHLLSVRIPEAEIQLQWVDLARLRERPNGIAERIRNAILLYPCDILFIHRDAEREPYYTRMQEIEVAIAELSDEERIPYIPVIPVRMTEAWLLLDRQAIRNAVGNPNGKISLDLPNANKVEDDPDPKQTLQALLSRASELSGRRLAKLNVHQCTFLVSEYINDFRPLLKIPSVARLAADIDREITLLENTRYRE